jgi:ABC-type uncharacterized transport system substrate-binding protein
MRRVALALALGLCAAVPAFAQNAETLPLVGWLRISTAVTSEPGATLLRTALAALGQVDGRNIRLEIRFAEGHAERLPELAEALVRQKASVILATGIHAIRAAQRATSTIPIVADDDDLLAEGPVASLAKPGGNTTGTRREAAGNPEADRARGATHRPIARSVQQRSRAISTGCRYGAGARCRASDR